jgi:hypothetical protein
MVVQEGNMGQVSVHGGNWEMAGSSWGETVINPYMRYEPYISILFMNITK